MYDVQAKRNALMNKASRIKKKKAKRTTRERQEEKREFSREEIWVNNACNIVRKELLSS